MKRPGSSGALRVLAATMLAAGLACGAQAQPAAAPATEASGGAVSSHARSLIRMLQDDAARAGLVEELERIAGEEVAAGRAAAGGAAAPPHAPPAAEAAPEAAAAPRAPSIGDRVAAAVPAILVGLADGVRDVWAALRETVPRLGGFARLDTAELWRILRGVAPVALAAVAAAVASRRAMLPVYRRLGAAADRERMLRTGLIAVLAVALDFLTVLAGAVAGLIAVEALGGGDAEVGAFRMAFLSAFVVAGTLLVAIRAIFSPAAPELRLLPASDAAARYWSTRIGLIAVVIAFGELFVRGFVAEVATPPTASAALVVIHMLTGLYLVGLIVINRRAPAAYFERRAAENDEDLAFAILAGAMRFWHYVAIALVAVLMHQLLTSSGGALPIAFVAAEIVAAFAVAAFAVALVTRIGDRGVRLPERLKRAMPALEGRINAFVPAFLRLFRLAVLAVWAAYVLQVVGILSLRDWLERRVGVDVLGAAASVILIVLAGFLAWLALVSWIDYRLTPRVHGRAATSRERTLLALLRNATTVFILVVGLMFVLGELGVSIAPLIASAGVLGLAIGFGAQKMVEDIIGGAFIQFENAINVGDVVQAGGITGVVEKLTIRSVGLRDVQGVYHVIPFSAVSTVSNHTKGFGYHVADIALAHRADVDAAKAEMLAAHDDLKADAGLGPKLIGDLEWFGVQSLDPSSVMLRARLKTWPGEQWAVGRAYSERLKKRFDAAGIQIALPHLTLWFGDGTTPRDRLPPAPEPARPAPIRAGSPTDADPDAGDPGAGDGHR